MKTAELEGALLDYWVARALGYEFIDIPPDANGENASRILAPQGLAGSGWTPAPQGKYGHMLLPWSTDWAQGGLIIDRERISTWCDTPAYWEAGYRPEGSAATNESDAVFRAEHLSMGDTALIAAMRAFVCSVFGDEVADADH